MYTQLPRIFKVFFPKLVWDIKTTEKLIYLTFDDGPHPEITQNVLDILDQFKAKATFFCVGENVEKHPETYRMILRKGHKTGNHTHNHLNGWKTPSTTYYANVEQCAKLVDSYLFRPPHGKINPIHIPYLKMRYQIIMWSVLTEDYRQDIKPEKCFNKSIAHTKAGSIVVFHDSEKAAENMLYALPRFLGHFTERGYRFPVIKD